ncbi:GtrA family protein [Conexibacter woesei]|uniref:GtrA family protein n=1 Tax=Conexibacter woesei TaxID=191495 RepID=UPI0004051319|nr:GtrA family protein [Conexibacter woesei]
MSIALPHPPSLRGPLPRQVVRFAVVGASNTVLTFIAYILLSAVMPAVAAAVLGWAVGAANGYRLNRGWTFASAARGLGPAGRYLVVQGLAAGVSAGGVVVLGGSVPHAVAELVSLPVASALAFVLCRAWVFAA